MTDTSTDTGTARVDLLDPTFWQADPHDFWTEKRSAEPVFRDANGFWAVTRHADVLAVERAPGVFSSKGTYRAVEAPEEQTMISQDDPEHLAQRRLVNRNFTPRAVRGHTEEFETLIDELIAPVTERGELEVVDELAAQLPARLTCRLLGLDEEADWRNVKSWSERLMRLDTRERDEAIMLDTIGVNLELYARVQDEVVERRGCPADDLLSTWSNAELDGHPWSEQRIYHETGLFVSGGAETTRTVIAHGLRTFCDHPDQWERLYEEPELVPSAVEEMIRWVTPLNNFFRKATQDTVVGGTDVAAGERVILVYPSANRDEEVFEDPFSFDIAREPNHHLAFGHGTHFCIGANFARRELAVLLGALTRRWTNLRPVTEPDVEPNVFARAVRSFRLAFDAR